MTDCLSRTARRVRPVLAAMMALPWLAAPAFAGGAEAEPPIQWTITETETADGHPVATLGLTVAGREVVLRRDQPLSYAALAPGQWAVPDGAATAALGWWAGRGEVLYAVRHPDRVEVFLRRIEEEDAGETFRRIMTIPLAPTE